MTSIGKKIGVLIPTYNRVDFLSLALDSARAQTHENLQILVIDNSSTDKTSEYMATLDDQRVVYIVNEKNLGMIGSINKGLPLFSAEVEWCTILSDDDTLDKDCIANLVRAVIAANAKSIVHSHRIFIDHEGNKIKEAKLSPPEESAFDYLRMRALFKRETYLTGVLFNRNAFGEINGYPTFKTGVASDDAFIFALALKDRLVFNKHAHAFIRIHEAAESVSSADAMNKLQTVKQFEEYCKKAVIKAGGFDRQQRAKFEDSMNKYVKIMNSFWWIQAAHSFSGSKERERGRVAELLSIADNDRGNYTFRVKFALLIHNVTGVFLEQNRTYRGCWHGYIKLYLFMVKLVSFLRGSRSTNQ